MSNVIVRVHRGQLAYFRRKARQSEKEQYAMLIGNHLSPSVVDIHRFVYPKLKVQSASAVQPDDDAYKREVKKAIDAGMTVVGTIHSHPNWMPVMSSTDHDGHVAEGDSISAVVGTMNGKTWVYFWRADSSLPCKIEFFD